jgi:hypothetical protein
MGICFLLTFVYSIQIQNADDNTYLEDVEPTLAFVLRENGIIVLNNERGFSAENIRALCDIGNSTKKEANRGYIGNKGIGFKSVFRVGLVEYFPIIMLPQCCKSCDFTFACFAFYGFMNFFLYQSLKFFVSSSSTSLFNTVYNMLGN